MKFKLGTTVGEGEYYDSGDITADTTITQYITATTTSLFIKCQNSGNGGTLAYFDNISVKQDDLVLNGAMEIDDHWNSLGSPTTNERSTTQVYSGTYSRKCVADAHVDGLQSDTFSVVAGATYQVSFYYYLEIAAGPTSNWIMKFKDGDGSDLDPSHTLTVTGAWTNVTFFTTATATGSGSYFQAFQSGAGASTLYLDNVSVKQINGNPGTLVNTPTFSTDIP
jgi:hypothetical protein